MKILAARMGPTVWDEDGPTSQLVNSWREPRDGLHTANAEKVKGGNNGMFRHVTFRGTSIDNVGRRFEREVA